MEYLQSLTDVTIILTTHYLQETVVCDKIGVLRRGRLIAEESPNVLLEKYGATTLEQVVLELCHSDNICQEIPVDGTPTTSPTEVNCDKSGSISKHLSIIKSLVKLNVTITTRNSVFVSKIRNNVILTTHQHNILMHFQSTDVPTAASNTPTDNILSYHWKRSRGANFNCGE